MNYILNQAARPGRVSKGQFWRKIMREFDASGQGVRRFCKSRHICSSSFYRWRILLAEQGAFVKPTGSSSPAAIAAPVFLPVRVAARETSRIEIVLGDGRRVRLSGAVDPAALEQVLAVISGMKEGRSC